MFYYDVFLIFFSPLDFPNFNNYSSSVSPSSLNSFKPPSLNVCPVCPYSSSDLRNFKRHLLIHTGEQRFICDICSRPFSRKEHLKRHVYIHIRNDTYYCKQCNRDFLYKDALKSHMNSMHAHLAHQ